MNEGKALQDLVLLTDIQREMIQEILRIANQTLQEKKQEHGQEAVAKAVLAGKACRVYEFQAEADGSLPPGEKEKIRLFESQLSKRGVSYVKADRENGSLVIIVRESDKDLARSAAHQVNLDITRNYMDSHSPEREKEEPLGKSGKDHAGIGTESFFHDQTVSRMR